MTRPGVLLALLWSLVACSHARVQTAESYVGPALPRPERVFVAYFSVAPGEVRLDQSVGARLTRVAEPTGTEALQAARDAQSVLTRNIVAKLRSYVLPAEIAADQTGGGSGVLVQGQIVSIDQGNRMRRLLIGLGAGKSSVTADRQLYQVTSSTPPRLLTAFEAQADSGRTPGAAETLGAGAAAQRIGTSTALAGATHGGVESRGPAETGQLAEAIARRIGQFAADQGWIPQIALNGPN